MRTLNILSQWLLVVATGLTAPAAGFRFAPVNDNALGLWEGDLPVLVYNHGVIQKEGVPADRARSSYIHPLYGLDGEVLTDDFPRDHYHHRGLFWAWPHVGIEGREYDLWMLNGIRHQFERWREREVAADRARLSVDNGWYVGDRKVMDEQLELTVHPAAGDHRSIDVTLTWTPTDRPVRLAGAEGKSYGGLTLRYAPGTNTVITTPQGSQPEDLYITRLPWADLTRQFSDPAKGKVLSGAAIFIAPDHPDFPPTWLTRHYGVLCLGWPGVDGGVLQPGVPVRCRYRVWIHRGAATGEALRDAYAGFREQKPATAADAMPRAGLRGATAGADGKLGEVVTAATAGDRVRVRVGNELFTEYLFGDDLKYPYFYPLNGPRSGKSVTVHRTEPYPHHSSLFFGCDRVNGGNYWQEGLERGRIDSRAVRVTDAGPKKVVIEQDCVWERPGADSPLSDRRRIRITAPSPDRRLIDFDITLTALTDVRIEKSNHALFSARLAPELAVNGGGRLINAEGASGEKATFGQHSPWMDGRGSRDGVVEGLTIFDHLENRWHPSPWFTRDYGFFSPTPMYWLEGGELRLTKGTVLHLRYRVLVHGDNPTANELAALHASWSTAVSP